jgi:glycosyltransferase involved in cell wall biosynthesis
MYNENEEKFVLAGVLPAMPEVSVVIPTYNSATLLCEAVESVLEQTYQDFEIIVVDDGSTDNTRQMAEVFRGPKVKYIFQPNQGPPVARNTGIRASSGRLVAFLDADDIWLPFKLELQVKALENSPQAGLAYCDMFLYDMDQQAVIGAPFLQRCPRPPPRGEVFAELSHRFFGHPSTTIIRREVFDRVGFFDESLRYCDDYDMLFRIASRFEFELVSAPLVAYRFHKGQLSGNPEPYWQGHVKLFNKFLKYHSVSPPIRRRYSRQLAGTHFHYGVFLARRKQYSSGINEILNSARTDFLQLFPLSFSYLKRTAAYLGKKIWR